MVTSIAPTIKWISSFFVADIPIKSSLRPIENTNDMQATRIEKLVNTPSFGIFPSESQKNPFVIMAKKIITPPIVGTLR